MADEVTGLIDVIIVGAGPAGISAAKYLRGNGLSVLIVERLSDEAFDRYHSICGEAVSERSFRKLGWRPANSLAVVDGIRIRYQDSSVYVPSPGYIIDRPATLKKLRTDSLAEFIRGTVVSVTRQDDVYRLELSNGSYLHSTYLIGADGAHSVVRRDVFGMNATRKIALVNCIGRGRHNELTFEVSSKYPGSYAWMFPSEKGTVSIGFPKGSGSVDDVDDLMSWGARDLPFGKLSKVVDGNCMLLGDAACLANPLSYGGIGIAMISGMKAAEAILDGNPSKYQHWVDYSLALNKRFLKAHDQFSSWTNEDIEEALRPLIKGYSIPKGLIAMIRHPKWANIYYSLYLAFKIGW